MADAASAGASLRSKLLEVALLFLRLGFTAFGGPAAHIAIMESEVVHRRKWLSPEKFLDLLGAANLIPGPSSTELAIFIGYEQAGVLGLVLGGVCFILPAAAMVTALAWAYVHFGTVPQVAGVLYGIKPVVIAVIAQALWGLAPKAVKKSFRLGLLGLGACLASALKLDALLVLMATGVASLTWVRLASGDRTARAVLFGGIAGSGAAAAAPVGLLKIFLSFLKVGSVVFGSGYVLLALLREDFVDQLHWLTERQLLDAVAIGQVTPGPVFTTATFIGYVLAGVWGAFFATVGIFLPGFLLVAFSRLLLVRIRSSQLASAALDGVNVAAVGLMAVVTVQLARAALVDGVTVALAVVSAGILLGTKVSPTWLVVGAGVCGLVVHGVR